MFNTNIVSAFICCLFVVNANPEIALANEIVSESGSTRVENGVQQYFAPTNSETPASMFKFQYHPRSEIDPENLLFENITDTHGVFPQPESPISLDPVELFQKYYSYSSNVPPKEVDTSDGEDMLPPTALQRLASEPEVAALLKQSLAGGVAAAFSDMVLMDTAVVIVNCINPNGTPSTPNIEPHYSALRISSNPIRGNAVVTIYSHKKILCIVDGQMKTIPLKRRWVISVPNGFEQGDVDGLVGNPPMATAYKMFARGKNIKMMAYYSNLTLSGDRYQQDMRLISGFDENGNVDPRDKYYDARSASCIDIDFKTKPPNGGLVQAIPSDMRFCARGCIPGDVSATR
jgi:hypothetical protein